MCEPIGDKLPTVAQDRPELELAPATPVSRGECAERERGAGQQPERGWLGGCGERSRAVKISVGHIDFGKIEDVMTSG